MERNSKRAATLAVFILAAVGYFLIYGSNNDHFDRISRARQIAVFGEVPFRDFFDPGYFLTLYASAFLQRALGDNLLGEFLLNISFMAAGTTLVFLLASKASRTLIWGLIAAALVIASQPRTYDYDKILFFPLGVYVCWAYTERPTVRSLLGLSATTVIAGLFRYDSGVYIGTAALMAILVTHWGDWTVAARRVAGAGLTMSILAAPALLFIERTAGLKDAFQQIATYAQIEGERSKIFHPVTFALSRNAQSFHGLVTEDNALAWLYHVAVGLPLVTILIPLLRPENRRRARVARFLSFSVLSEFVALFLLRDPMSARVPSVMPLVGIGGGILVNEWRFWVRPSPESVRSLFWPMSIAGAGIVVCSLTVGSVAELMWIPPIKNFQLGDRLSLLMRTPPALELLPKGELQPIVEYLRDCTKSSDRVMMAWFAAEAYFFSGRGFAAGLPVMLGGHWSDLRYQRRAIQILEGQSVPLIVTLEEQPIDHYEFLWNFVRQRYQLAYDGKLGPSPRVNIWARHDQPVERRYGALSLPCYAGGSAEQ